MDTGKGKFEQVTANSQDELAAKVKALEEQFPQHGGWFRVGEIVELKGSRFRVQSVKPNQLRLKLLPKGK